MNIKYIETLTEMTFKQWIKDQPWVIFSRTLAEQAWENRSLIIYDANAKIAGLLTDIEKLQEENNKLKIEASSRVSMAQELSDLSYKIKTTSLTKEAEDYAERYFDSRTPNKVKNTKKSKKVKVTH